MAKIHVENTLQSVVQILTDTAPAHKSKLVQEWLKENVPNFIRHTDWPLGTPHIKPLDYDPWNYLEQNE